MTWALFRANAPYFRYPLNISCHRQQNVGEIPPYGELGEVSLGVSEKMMQALNKNQFICPSWSLIHLHTRYGSNLLNLSG